MSSTPLIDPAMARSGNMEVEMRSRQREIEQNRKNLNAGNQKTKEEKLRESCEGFEAMFIQKMWEGMRASLPQDGLMQSRDEKHWQGMYDQELGKSMAKAGGIGLADMMVSQMSRNLQNASDVAAGSAARRRPMDIAPAPLLPEQKPAPAPVAPQAASPQAASPQAASPQAASPQATAQQAGQAGQAAGKPGLDLYSEAAPVAATPEAEASPTSGTPTADAAMPSPPEVQNALASLATLATQAEVARGVGVQTVGQFTGQPAVPGQPVQPGQMNPNNQMNPASQTSEAAGQAPQAGQPVQPNSRRRPNVVPVGDEVQHITRNTRSRQNPAQPSQRTARAAQNAQAMPPSGVPNMPAPAGMQNASPYPTAAASPFAAPGTGMGQVSEAGAVPGTGTGTGARAGANFAQSSVSQTATPRTGQIMPGTGQSAVSAAATDLLKSQLGQPSVKTRL